MLRVIKSHKIQIHHVHPGNVAMSIPSFDTGRTGRLTESLIVSGHELVTARSLEHLFAIPRRI